MRRSLLLTLITTAFANPVPVFASDANPANPAPATMDSPVSDPVSASKTTGNHAAIPTTKPVSGIDLQWLDTSVRPQDDFFRYMSGKWLDSVTIPADRARYGTMDGLRDQSEKNAFAIITSLAASKELRAGSNQRKIADLYHSFMDEAQAEKLDIKPLQGEFAQIDALKDKAALPALLARITRQGINMPVQSGVTQDGRDAARHAVIIAQGGLAMPDRDYYLKDDAKFKDYREAYLKHVEKMLAMSGQFDAAQAASSASAILALETRIAQIQWSKVENRDQVKTYNKLDLEKLAALLPGFDWNQYFSATGMQGKMDYVIVRQPEFLGKLQAVLESTPLATWQAYCKWHVLNAYAPFLSKRFVDQDFAFTSVVLRGIPEQQPRWKRGVARVEEAMGEALGQLYVEKHFSPSNKVRMQSLVDNMLLAYKDSISNLAWMTPDTKKAALEKLSKFRAKIAYPDQWRDYSSLQVVPDNLLQNVKNGREHGYQRQLAKLSKPVDRNEWNMSPQTVNAYYNPRQNEIVFPAAILTPPFFNPEAEDAVNYGGIGGVIGHEISHGFDDSGSQSDGDGNLRDWWQDKDKANFKQLAAQLSSQYDAYSPLPGYHLNGKLTLGENLADNSGLAIAWKAYQLSLKGKPAPVLDGFTGEQRVIMGWAQVWRGKARDAESIRLINTDPHSPAQFRANGPLSNLPGFYQAFDVKPGDKMYVEPAKRTVIW